MYLFLMPNTFKGGFYGIIITKYIKLIDRINYLNNKQIGTFYDIDL